MPSAFPCLYSPHPSDYDRHTFFHTLRLSPPFLFCYGNSFLILELVSSSYPDLNKNRIQCSFPQGPRRSICASKLLCSLSATCLALWETPPESLHLSAWGLLFLRAPSISANASPSCAIVTSLTPNVVFLFLTSLFVLSSSRPSAFHAAPLRFPSFYVLFPPGSRFFFKLLGETTFSPPPNQLDLFFSDPLAT